MTAVAILDGIYFNRLSNLSKTYLFAITILNWNVSHSIIKKFHPKSQIKGQHVLGNYAESHALSISHHELTARPTHQANQQINILQVQRQNKYNLLAHATSINTHNM